MGQQKARVDALWVTVIKVGLPVPGRGRVKEHIIVRFAAHGRCCGDERFVIAAVRSQVGPDIPVHGICFGNDSGVAIGTTVGHGSKRAPLSLLSEGRHGFKEKFLRLGKFSRVLGAFVIGKTNHDGAFKGVQTLPVDCNREQPNLKDKMKFTLGELAARLFAGRDSGIGQRTVLDHAIEPWHQIQEHPLLITVGKPSGGNALPGTEPTSIIGDGPDQDGATLAGGGGDDLSDLGNQLSLFNCFPRMAARAKTYEDDTKNATRNAFRHSTIPRRKPPDMGVFTPHMQVLIRAFVLKETVSQIAAGVSSAILCAIAETRSSSAPSLAVVRCDELVCPWCKHPFSPRNIDEPFRNLGLLLKHSFVCIWCRLPTPWEALALRFGIQRRPHCGPPMSEILIKIPQR